MEKPTHWHYDTIARGFHWLIALLIFGLIGLGWYMTSIGDKPYSGWYFDLHKSFGVIVGILICLRILWRLTHTPAPLPASVPRWQALASKTIHGLLYACMIIMPMSGFLGSSLGKYGVVFFGITLPNWLKQNLSVSKQLFEVHRLVVWILVGLLVLHILAAIKHLLINKDSVFQRMWFSR